MAVGNITEIRIAAGLIRRPDAFATTVADQMLGYNLFGFKIINKKPFFTRVDTHIHKDAKIFVHVVVLAKMERKRSLITT